MKNKIIYIAGIFLFLGISLLIGSCGMADAFGGGFSGGRAAEKSMARTVTEGESQMDLFIEDGIEMEPTAGMAAPEPAPLEEAADDVSPTTSSLSQEQAPEKQEEERKRVYSGYAELLVDNVDKTKMEITDLAETSGGYVEYIVENAITIRVPAVRFSELFTFVQEYGEVLSSYEETVDVTEYFSDLSTRLKIAAETRERLYALLERTEDVEERIKILQEIRRLSEEIERINLSLESLKDHISFSRITLQLYSRLEFDTGYRDDIPFPWIESLHPLYPLARKFKGSFKGSLPDNFAVFKKDKYYHAETAEGVRFRISTVRNKPQGDAPFWQEALRYHLSPRYAGTETKELGNIPWVIFTGKDRNPYIYAVGIQADGRKLHVLELFFPSTADFEILYPDIENSLEEVIVR